MPIYKNTGLTTRVINGKNFAPSIEVATQFYINHPDLSFISHNPRVRPFVTLYDDTIPNLPAGKVTGMEEYTNMVIQNRTGNTITLIANDDTANEFLMLDNASWNFELERGWKKLDITGSGAGKVYVTVTKSKVE